MMDELLPREDFLAEMEWRGFSEQCTDPDRLAELLARETVTAYIGFDPTAESLHIGSMVPIMGLVHLQRHGHRPIAIVGGATAMVGDPSGRTELRQMLSLEQIEQNLEGIKSQLARFIRFGDGPADGLMVNNADWLKDYNYIDFLRDVGRNFSVNRMLAMESVKSRLETGLSFIEFNYMLLQAFDFMVLNRDHGCRLQMGGSDQWGNICAGIDLTRRLNQQEVFGLTFPLISTPSGSKMGKSAAGAVWLDARRTSPFDFFQSWVNAVDEYVAPYLRLFTLLPREEVERLSALTGADIREAKRVLAFEVTKLVHGEEDAREAEKAAAALFGGAAEEGAIPSSQRPAGDLAGDGLWIADALVAAGLCRSKGDARRLVRQQGVRVNGEVVSDEMMRLGEDDVHEGRIALQVGKKRHHHILIQ